MIKKEFFHNLSEIYQKFIRKEFYMSVKRNLPTVRLTQQDFVSTFPWGLTGDRVRILEQETENLLLDAESAAAMAVMLGHETFTEQLDTAWKTYLNSQNHDIHVCSQEKAGIDWCLEAMPLAEKIRKEAGNYIAQILGSDIELNTLSWNRKNSNGTEIPAFGYVPQKAPAAAGSKIPWIGWFRAGAFQVRVVCDGTLEIRIGNETNIARIGNLTVEKENQKLDSRSCPLQIKDAFIDLDGQKASVTLEGSLGDILYRHHITISQTYIDYTTEFDYGESCNFGPDIKDFEENPRRTHYFQHERKLCMNFSIAEKNAALLYNSPFLTWPAAKDAHSIESLHYVALQGKEYGLAHMNIGQCAYAHEAEDSHAYHVLAFAPHDYIYGRPQQIVLSGKHVHHYRFLPYTGDWREASLTKRSHEFNRKPFTTDAGILTDALMPASLIQIKANSTISTALFERDGKVFVRLAEWAGQEDSVELIYGDETSVFTDSTHALEPIAKLDRVFKMRPWEIKTIQIEGKAVPLTPDADCCSRRFHSLPSGWNLKNLFECKAEKLNPPAADGDLYFVSGYHDGFVRPLEKHTPTMEIEMERTKQYDGYTNAWEVGGSCWVRMAENEPQYLEELKHYLKDGSVEITGGTWCEPFSLIVSGESNIRQMFYGIKTFHEVLDYQITIYNNQEHATYAQMPQILRSFGLYAVVNRTQWAPYGYESAIDSEVANWVGPDGSSIWVIPRYHSMDYKTCPWEDRNLQNGSVTGHNRVWRTEEKFEQMRTEALAQGVAYPLMTMIEDIWSPALRTTDEELEFYNSLPKVKFISFTRYLEMFGITPTDH